MDIKDFILIAGGLLIAAVIAHGFWIAWRSKSEPLRLDIVPDLLSSEDNELARFKGELPNGGSRVIDRWPGGEAAVAAGAAPATGQDRSQTNAWPDGGRDSDHHPSQPDLLGDGQVPVLLEPNLVDKAAVSPTAKQLDLGRDLGRDNDPLPATLAGPVAAASAADVANAASEKTAKHASRAAAERELFGVRMDTGRARGEEPKVRSKQPPVEKTLSRGTDSTVKKPRRRGRSDPRHQGEPDLFAKAAADPMPESRRSAVSGSDRGKETPDTAPTGSLDPVGETGSTSRRSANHGEQPTAQTRVAEVVLPSAPIVSDPSMPPANEVIPTDLLGGGTGKEEAKQAIADAAAKYSEPKASSASRTPLRPARSPEPPRPPERRYKSRHLTPKTAPEGGAQPPAEMSTVTRQPIEPVSTIEAPVATASTSGTESTLSDNSRKDVGADLIVIHLLAPKGTNYFGPQLVESLRARGLKYGAMGIFHRTDPMTKANVYSVVNMVEPGHFDLSALDTFASPGLTFFMQLPGSEDPVEALADMVDVARSLAQDLGGDVKDEHMSVLTGQTVAHLRQVISDHARRRLSQRA